MKSVIRKLWQAFLTICLLVFWPNSVFAQTSVPSGAVLLHEYNNDTTDSSGNGNNGVAFGSPVFVAGNIDQAIDLDGIGDYVEVSNSPTLQPEFVSVEICFKPRTPLNQNSKFVPLVVKLDPSRTLGGHIDGYALNYETRGLENPEFLRGSFLAFQIGDVNSQGAPGTLAIHADFETVIGIDTFHHAVGTYDGSVIHLYFDGNLAVSTIHSSPISYLGERLNIGGHVRHNTLIPSLEFLYFDGVIDEVVIYNRALTAQEVATRAERCLTPATVQVVIDIKPGSDPNSINLSAAGVIPVAILSTAVFDAPTDVNPDTLFFAGARVRVVGKGNKFLCHSEDVNGDGFLDLVCQFENDLNAEIGDSIAVLEGATFAGAKIRGEDSIRIVPD